MQFFDFQLKTTMFSAALKSPTGRASIRYRRGMIAFTVMLFLSVTYAHSTTVEHDLHIVHNVDNRSKFWSEHKACSFIFMAA